MENYEINPFTGKLDAVGDAPKLPIFVFETDTIDVFKSGYTHYYVGNAPITFDYTTLPYPLPTPVSNFNIENCTPHAILLNDSAGGITIPAYGYAGDIFIIDVGVWQLQVSNLDDKIPNFQKVSTKGGTTTNVITIGSNAALAGTTANLQLKGAMLIDNIGSNFATSQTVVRENLEITLAGTSRFGHFINTNVNADTTSLTRQLRNLSTNLNYTGTFNSTSAYLANTFSVTHGNTGINTNSGSNQYYTNVFANTNIVGNNTTNGISAIVGRISTNNPSFSGTATEVNAVAGEFQTVSLSAVTGTFTTLNLFKAQYNANTAFLPNITNLRAIHIDSNFDNISATNKWAIFSESTSTSRLNGDLELITRLKLRGLVNFVNLQANSATSPYTFTLPPNAGNANEVLITDGLGTTSWSALNSIPEWIASPATSTSSGLQGQKAYDATHVYFCVQDNVWVRVSRDLTVW